MKCLHLLLFCAALPALSYTITYDPSMPVLAQQISLSVNGDDRTVYAGQIGGRIDGTVPAILYCADPLTWLALGPTQVTPILETGFVNGPRLAWLYNTYNPIVTEGWEAAALQLAIWDIITDGAVHANSGTDPNVVAASNNMLVASAGQSSSGVVFWVPNAGPSASQTLLSLAVPPPLETPEPSNGLLFGAGLLLFGAVRRWR